MNFKARKLLSLPRGRRKLRLEQHFLFLYTCKIRGGAKPVYKEISRVRHVLCQDLSPAATPPDAGMDNDKGYKNSASLRQGSHPWWKFGVSQFSNFFIIYKKMSHIVFIF